MCSSKGFKDCFRKDERDQIFRELHKQSDVASERGNITNSANDELALLCDGCMLCFADLMKPSRAETSRPKLLNASTGDTLINTSYYETITHTA